MNPDFCNLQGRQQGTLQVEAGPDVCSIRFRVPRVFLTDSHLDIPRHVCLRGNAFAAGGPDGSI